jgi:hypothetical protein
VFSLDAVEKLLVMDKELFLKDLWIGHKTLRDKFLDCTSSVNFTLAKLF